MHKLAILAGVLVFSGGCTTEKAPSPQTPAASPRPAVHKAGGQPAPATPPAATPVAVVSTFAAASPNMVQAALPTTQIVSGSSGAAFGVPNPSSAVPLTGEWDAVGYTCKNLTPTVEIVSIDQNASGFTATKVTGDPCVPGGNLTFKGTIANGSLTVVFTGLTPGGVILDAPNSVPGTYSAGVIKILGDNVYGPVLTLTPHHAN